MPDSIRTSLRAALTAAMKRGDRTAAGVYRTALAAIDNAEASPAGDGDRGGAIEASRIGAGAADVSRRELTESDMTTVVQAEIDERFDAARSLDTAAADAGASLRHEAQLLQAVLADTQASR